MSMFKCCFVISFFLTLSYAQVVKDGSCKDVELVTNFDFESYSGHWYEYAISPFHLEAEEKCTEFYYNSTGNKNTVRLTQLYVDGAGQKSNYTRTIRFNQETGIGMTTNNFPFRVMDTDYKNYAVLYACAQTSSTYREVTWILTRQRFPEENTIDEAREVVLRNGIRLYDLHVVKQRNCPNNYEDADMVYRKF